jgi:hypothetical protein
MRVTIPPSSFTPAHRLTNSDPVPFRFSTMTQERCHKFNIQPDDPTRDLSPETMTLLRPQIDTICSRSIELNNQIVRDQETGCTTLQPDLSVGIDHDTLSFLVRNLYKPAPQAVGPVTSSALSRSCNALWRYKCNPDTFRGLATELKNSWNIKHGERNGTGRCWRLPISDIDCDESVYIVNIACVLGFDDILREELKIAIWKSTADLRTSVELLQNLTSKHDH